MGNGRRYKVKDISLIIPSYNNLRYLENVYESIRKYYPTVEVVLMDDGSSDGTKEWIAVQALSDSNIITYYCEERVGHTVLYDTGIGLSTKEVVGILHADMYIGPNYLENLLKHVGRKKVVCATRIEPPLHPPSAEKITRNFGIEYDDINKEYLERFIQQEQCKTSGTKTRGMFAPWIILKEDFENVGGHDPRFAPFPFEDSDIFQRWILAGYKLIQSRDSYVYHLTCRGHRWTKDIQVDDEFYKKAVQTNARTYIRKWGTWIENDHLMYPVIHPRYRTCLRAGTNGTNLDLLIQFEIYFDKIEIDRTLRLGEDFERLINYSKRVFKTDELLLSTKFLDIENCDVYVTPLVHDLDLSILANIQKVVKSIGRVGTAEVGGFSIEVRKFEDVSKDLIHEHIYSK